MQRAACFIVILFASLSAHHANSAPGAPIRERGHGPAVRPAAAPPHVTTPRHVGTTVGQHWGQPAHPVNNPSHQVYVHNSITNRDEPHRMIVDHRPAYVIDHDP